MVAQVPVVFCDCTLTTPLGPGEYEDPVENVQRPKRKRVVDLVAYLIDHAATIPMLSLCLEVRFGVARKKVLMDALALLHQLRHLLGRYDLQRVIEAGTTDGGLVADHVTVVHGAIIHYQPFARWLHEVDGLWIVPFELHPTPLDPI